MPALISCGCTNVSKRCAAFRRTGDCTDPEAGEVMIPCGHWIAGPCCAKWSRKVRWESKRSPPKPCGCTDSTGSAGLATWFWERFGYLVDHTLSKPTAAMLQKYRKKRDLKISASGGR